LKFFKITILFLLLTSCQYFKEEQPPRLYKHTVYAIYDTIGSVRKIKINADTSYLEHVFNEYELVDIQSIDSSIKVNLKYADTSNFLKKDFYDGLRKAYFPCEVALQICNAQYYLKQINPGLSLQILDGARPLHVQQMMWDSLNMPPDKKFNYLAPPYTISLHNYGCAVDLTIIDLATGKSLDMGTEFDHFEKLSEPVREWQFLKTGELSREAFGNRKLLRKVMQMAKFLPITSEWWHFNFCTKDQASAKFRLIK